MRGPPRGSAGHPSVGARREHAPRGSPDAHPICSWPASPAAPASVGRPSPSPGRPRVGPGVITRSPGHQRPRGSSKGPTPGGRLNRGGRTLLPPEAVSVAPRSWAQTHLGPELVASRPVVEEEALQFRPRGAPRSATPAFPAPSRPRSARGPPCPADARRGDPPRLGCARCLRPGPSVACGSRATWSLLPAWGSEAFLGQRVRGFQRQPRGSCRRPAPGKPGHRGARVRNTRGHPGVGARERARAKTDRGRGNGLSTAWAWAGEREYE